MKKVLTISIAVIAILTVLTLGTIALLGQNEKTKLAPPGGLTVTPAGGSKTDRCYLDFYVNAEKLSDKSVRFTMATETVHLLFGSFESTVRNFHEGDGAPYLLQPVDSSGNALGKYNVYVSFGKIVEWMTPKGMTGKIVPVPKTSVYNIIPYDTSIAKIVITEGTSTKQVASFPIVIPPSQVPVGCAK